MKDDLGSHLTRYERPVPYVDANQNFLRRRGQQMLTIVVGGQGAIGQMLRRELGDQLGRIIDIDPRSSRDAADITSPGIIERDLLTSADTVVLAVHEPIALAAIPYIMQTLSPDALLVETLSVKTQFAKAIADRPPSFEVLGINPMFGPTLDMADRAVAVVPFLARERAAWFSSLLAARGAQVIELSAEAHDKTAAALQVIPHVLILAFARALSTCDIDLTTALKLAPPPASAMVALAARISSGDPQLYSEIQAANPFAAPTRASLEAALAEVTVASTDIQPLGSLLADIIGRFGESFPSLVTAAEHLTREQRPPLAAQYVDEIKY
jgi:prephenate dehydrogenase